ncbi:MULTISPECIES: response regulator [Edaphosphingomonas]|nr:MULTISPECIES: response regulator transcription factor [Sphingomonas]PTD25201.1 DNA-binding response regulator [Sphingomonas fennica]
MPPRRILIADDHGAMRRGIRDVLAECPHGQIVAEAADGHQALEMAREAQPHIAIIDYLLPLLNGRDLARALVREIPNIQVLIYTMQDRDDLLADILSSGARGYVLKSDPSWHLVAAVEALANRQPYFSGIASEALLQHFLRDTPPGASDTLNGLTTREREIVQLIAEGKINKQIAHLLGISIKTVETHRATAMHKLKIRSTAELVRYAVRNNITQA